MSIVVPVMFYLQHFWQYQVFIVSVDLEQWTGNLKTAGSNPVRRQLFCIACFITHHSGGSSLGFALVAFWSDSM